MVDDCIKTNSHNINPQTMRAMKILGMLVQRFSYSLNQNRILDLIYIDSWSCIGYKIHCNSSLNHRQIHILLKKHYFSEKSPMWDLWVRWLWVLTPTGQNSKEFKQGCKEHWCWCKCICYKCDDDHMCVTCARKGNLDVQK